MILRRTQLLRLRDLGYEGFYHTLGLCAAPDGVQRTLQGRTMALLTATPATAADALACMACLRALGADVLPIQGCDLAVLPMLAAQCNANVDAVIACGLPQHALESFSEQCAQYNLPLCNVGNTQHNPCAALGDIALFNAEKPPHDTLRLAWIGGVTGLAHSLIEAAMYMPFELFMAVPTWGEPDKNVVGLALKAGAKIFLTREPHMALDGAHYVYAGVPYPGGDALSAQAMRLTPDMLCHPQDQRVLAGDTAMPDEALWDAPLHIHRFAWRRRVLETLLPLWIAAATTGDSTTQSVTL